jgi:hypothetical protein
VGLDHLIVSLSQLQSFDHSQCDATLQARRIEVVNAYNPFKTGFERDSVYFGLYWGIGWLLLVLAGIFVSWRREDKNSKPARLVLPFFFLFGLGSLYVHVQAMAEYVDTCKRLLRAPRSTPPVSELVHPIVAAFIIVAFAAAWYSILYIKYREAKDITARFLPVAMMAAGGVFFGYVLLHLFR